MSSPLELITAIRDSFYGAEYVYTRGGCYKFYKILKLVFPDAVCYYDCDHVITKIGDKFYDITGEVDCGRHLEVTKDDESRLSELFFDSKNFIGVPFSGKGSRRVVNLNSINKECEEGRLLMAAIAKITTESQLSKTPMQVLKQLRVLMCSMFKK